ncbi:MAG: hypothetical protein QXO69_02335, partial [archaeon]
MTVPITTREAAAKREAELKKKAEEHIKKMAENARKTLESHGIASEESAYFFKLAYEIESLREKGRLKEAEQKASVLKSEIDLYKKVKQEAEMVRKRAEKEEVLPLKKVSEVKEDSMHDLRSLERNIGIKVFEGNRVSDEAKKLMFLVIKKNTAETTAEMKMLINEIM